MKNVRFSYVIPAALAVAMVTGCAHKKVAQATPPTPPPPPSPTATLTANPPAVEAGQPVTLSWNTQNANSVTIPGIGTLPASGTRSVMPQYSTSYVLTAKGPGGETEASARVTVNQKTASAAPSGPSLQDLWNQTVRDIYFDYDKYSVRADQQNAATAAAQFLAQHPDLKVTIEGHCDDRGSEEYNLSLGDSRASSLRSMLVEHGAKADQLKTMSYGKEHPFCSEDNEQCWQQNRRDHYVLNQGQ